MRIHLDVELPQWTRWFAASFAGVIVGAVGARVWADTTDVKTDWRDGDVLTAADLNASFSALKAAVNALRHPECPEDYVLNAEVTSFTVCKRGVDEVVRVGDGASAFWIDRYEASLWESADGPPSAQYGRASADEYPATFPENGENTAPAFALSLPNQKPSSYMTWFQAQGACRASGKRLPTGEEWLAAATGTTDPGSSAGSAGLCLTQSTGPRFSGQGTSCVSRWGAEDMIGNLWEWTTDWAAAVAAFTDPQSIAWPRDGSYHSDAVYNVTSSAVDNAVATTGLPVAVLRGGNWQDGTRAGRFSTLYFHAPSSQDGSLGVRCVIPR